MRRFGARADYLFPGVIMRRQRFGVLITPNLKSVK
jgi:hypothetical protein